MREPMKKALPCFRGGTETRTLMTCLQGKRSAFELYPRGRTGESRTRFYHLIRVVATPFAFCPAGVIGVEPTSGALEPRCSSVELHTDY